MAKTPTALDIKSATLYTLRAVLNTPDTAAVLAALNERVQEAGAFYEDESVVIDASGLSEPPDWQAIVAALRAHHLHPIGVQATPELRADALAAGLVPLDTSAGPRSAPASGTPAAQVPCGRGARAASTRGGAPSPAGKHAPPSADAGPDAVPDASAGTDAPAQTLVVRHPLRSGQRVYARGGDLIVMGVVSQGAEVIADGHIHVYGPLRGKAMAGARGRTDAMILTTQLDAELLAIAGVYRVVETQLPDSLYNQPAQITLDGETLRIQALETGATHLRI